MHEQQHVRFTYVQYCFILVFNRSLVHDDKQISLSFKIIFSQNLLGKKIVSGLVITSFWRIYKLQLSLRFYIVLFRVMLCNVYVTIF